MGLRFLTNQERNPAGIGERPGVPTQGGIRPGTRAPEIQTQENPLLFGQVLPGDQSNQFGFGNITDRSLGPMQSGQGFTSTSRALARQAIGSGMTAEDPGQAMLRGDLRAEIARRLAGLRGQTTEGQAALENVSSRGLDASLASLRRQLGGTGLSGSLQTGRVAGGLAAENQRNLSNQIQALRQQELQNAIGLVGAGGDIGQQSLQERQNRFAQANVLAQLLNRQAESEIQRDLGFAGVPSSPSDLEAGLAGLLSAGATVGGAALGGRPR